MDAAVPVGPVMAVTLTGERAPRGAVVLGRLATREPFDRADLEMVAACAEQTALALELAGTRAGQLTSVLGLRPEVHLVGPLDTLVEEQVADDVEAVVREALTTVGRHAGASAAMVLLDVDSTRLAVVVTDDGAGIVGRTTWSGLADLRARAEGHGGSLLVDHHDAGGLRLRSTVPITSWRHDDEALSAAVMDGASVYLLKEMVGSTLLEDIRQVARGGPPGRWADGAGAGGRRPDRGRLHQPPDRRADVPGREDGEELRHVRAARAGHAAPDPGRGLRLHRAAARRRPGRCVATDVRGHRTARLSQSRLTTVDASHCDVYVCAVREILWTKKTEDHIAVRAVTPAEVEQVVNTGPRLVLVGREETEYVFGTTDAGRYVLVVLAEAMDGRDYVVTAREMTDSERRTFRRRGR